MQSLSFGLVLCSSVKSHLVMAKGAKGKQVTTTKQRAGSQVTGRGGLLTGIAAVRDLRGSAALSPGGVGQRPCDKVQNYMEFRKLCGGFDGVNRSVHIDGAGRLGLTRPSSSVVHGELRDDGGRVRRTRRDKPRAPLYTVSSEATAGACDGLGGISPELRVQRELKGRVTPSLRARLRSAFELRCTL